MVSPSTQPQSQAFIWVKSWLTKIKRCFDLESGCSHLSQWVAGVNVGSEFSTP